MDQAEQQYNMETNDEFDDLTFEEKEEYSDKSNKTKEVEE